MTATAFVALLVAPAALGRARTATRRRLSAGPVRLTPFSASDPAWGDACADGDGGDSD